MESVVQKFNVKKLTSFIFVILRDVFENIYNFVEERDVKLKVHIIMKTLNRNIVLNIKKKTW